jgi:hypothetical protein
MRRETFDGYVEQEVKESTAVETVKTAPVIVPTIPSTKTNIENIKAAREAVANVSAATGQIIPSPEAAKVAAKDAALKAVKKAGMNTTSILLLVAAGYLAWKFILNPKN